METIKLIQTILVSLTALIIGATLLIAVLKAKDVNPQTLIDGITRLLQAIPPLRMEHKLDELTLKTLESINTACVKIEENTAKKGNGIREPTPAADPQTTLPAFYEETERTRR